MASWDGKFPAELLSAKPVLFENAYSQTSGFLFIFVIHVLTFGGP